MPLVRCSKCRGRQTLGRRPVEYIRLPRCKKCGRKMEAHPIDRRTAHYVIDHYRQRVERDPKLVCRPDRTGCRGYSFPHRRGSGYCDHNPNMTEEDFKERSSWA